MHLKAILFDLDGTLIDSYRDIAIHLNKTLKDFNKPQVEIQEVKYMVGGGARELLKRFFQDGILEEALKVFREYYLKEPVIHTKPFDGIMEVLERARSKGIELAVVTNKMESLSKVILQELSMAEYFSVVIGGDTLSEKKPSPLPVLEALRHVGALPSEAIIVGDTEADLKAGRLAGVKRGLALWGYVKVQEEVPDFELHSPSDLANFFNL
ncbi:MAG: HAD-IA family hydrolase [Aquificaceae bacterium]